MALNHTEAFNRYKSLAVQGDPQAQYQLGEIYRMGHGVPRDEAEARRWYGRSAAQGNEDAKTVLAALSGDKYAQARLGEYYYNGYGVEKNVAEAILWLTLAADQDADGDTQYTLGNIYYNGEETPKDYVKALKYFLMAAKWWSASAHDRLGDLYRHGHGVPKDPIAAYAWYSIAAHDGGDDDAIKALDELEKEMDPSDLAEARAKAQEIKQGLS